MMTQGQINLSRRDFVKSAALAAGLSAAGRVGSQAIEAAEPAAVGPRRVQPCLFSKPLGNRKVAELPRILKDLGIDAVDLTCRPGGHVLPEKVADDLPAAIERFKAAGVAVPMITTAITDAGKEHAERIVQTVGRLGIRYLKLGYYLYADMGRIPATVADAKARLRDVAALCRQHQVHAGYHIHSGRCVGAAMWDAWQLLEGLAAEDVGCYFDARHATAEGGLAGWEIGLNLLAPRITLLAVKDFVWRKDAKGKWAAEDVPLGEGMVRHGQVLARLKDAAFAGPVSLHTEYCSPKVEPGSAAEEANFDHIRRDWRTMLDLLRNAGLA
ncbi:MAG: TIM barrel protein [Planctomycetes bacterium]|nr:TIM barrel protein [Planctomycetota bacterium]